LDLFPGRLGQSLGSSGKTRSATKDKNPPNGISQRGDKPRPAIVEGKQIVKGKGFREEQADNPPAKRKRANAENSTRARKKERRKKKIKKKSARWDTQS